MTEHSLMDGDIVRLAYHANCAGDIIHPFSMEGYEMLTAEFMGWVESLRPMIPRNKPVLLEIVGCTLSEQEKHAVDNAIWTHYRLRLAEARKTLSASWKKLLIFVPCLLFSAILLFWAKNVQNEVAIQYLYLPFWFFSYRILTYPIFDHIPLLREMMACNQLASMKITMPGKAAQPLTAEERTAILRDYRASRQKAHISTLHSRLKEQLLMEDGILSFGCTVSSIQDLLNPACGDGTELLSDTLLDYLDQADDLIEARDTLRLEVDGPAASEKEKQKMIAAVRNSYRLRARSVRVEVHDNLRMILQFSLCLLLSGLLLNSVGQRADVAAHELLMVLFWFFGDYLVELILLKQLELNRERNKWLRMAEMDIVFKEKKKDA